MTDNPAMKLVLVLCLVALVVGDIVVTPFTSCTNCGVTQVLFTSSTSYLMLTADSKVWLSTDEGQHWTGPVASGINFMEQSPADPQSVLLVQYLGTIYTSTDGGQTTAKSSPPITNILSGVTMHPSQSSWLLAYSCNSLCSTWYSKDFGKSWQTGPSNLAVQFIVWGNDKNNLDTIFAVRSDSSFSYTTNYGSSWTTLFKNAIGYVLSSHYLYVGVVKSGGQTAQLYSSSARLDPSHTDPQYYWLDEFPTGNNLPQHGYTFLDDTTRSEFIAVKQPSQTNYWGTVFSSDFDGDQFTLSLNYVAQEELYYDFDKFDGLSGIYVANAYPSATSTNKQTYFSFDNGGEWKKLVAPTTDARGVPTNCSLANGCSLHIHGLISWFNDVFPPFYSSPNAIGLMVAVGNLGTALAATTQNSKTYLTRDGGITWNEIYSQPTIYEFGDHGGILVYAPISSPTNMFYYSLDEGKTSQSFTFTTSSIYVDNIFIEPSGTGLKFVLIGHTGSGPTLKSYIYGLDFSGLNLPLCQDADYENWSPSNDDNVNSNCFMGSKLVYKRRRQDAKCYNDRDTDHVIQSTPCPCAWEDYECDVGFTPSQRNGTDYFTCTAIHEMPACATGYRLIPDTTCDLASGMNLQSKNCPGYSGSPTTTTGNPSSTTSPSQTTGTSGTPSKGGSHTGAVVAIVLLLIILFGAAGAAGFMYYRNENFREWVLSKFSRGGSGGSYGRVNTDENDEEAGEDNTVSH
eukprot:Phypoly_transcript_02997.p1 GENE.Phypoly_transcript_02997~~Phypoly_transcript_02997.p1  ORF type:complete len:738 (+),score=114.01 Phypoly_transcript_02997:65-2278(+)